MTQKYLVDLCDIDDAAKIALVPRPLIHLGIQSGRIILDEGDPQLTRLALLGFKLLPLTRADQD